MTSQESLMFDCDGEYAEALEYESEGLEYESEGLEYDSDFKRDRDRDGDDEYDEKEYEEDDEEENWLKYYARSLSPSFNTKYNLNSQNNMYPEMEAYSNTGIDEYDDYINCKS